ncbi:hypothetical protein BN938_2580 [Mucinivorans hirudinis]|uniref:Four helix bundle protein n=1 Tax=Mucinivorans hirudinis TaxID=1433126 RepID=A0A060RAI3_9BACT|nr:hypothetical protein BN938_2580 [Mucinivorans hirudinis]
MSEIFAKSGGYRSLKCYRKTEIIYDATLIFCERFLQKSDRTYDQMVQAARSGKQNIAEGNLAAATSTKSELFLTNIARASLGELLEDYKDYLRNGEFELWGIEDERVVYVRGMGRQKDECFEHYREIIRTRSADTVANIMICLIHQAMYLLKRLLESMEERFLREGGINERMYAARVKSRGR